MDGAAAASAGSATDSSSAVSGGFDAGGFDAGAGASFDGALDSAMSTAASTSFDSPSIDSPSLNSLSFDSSTLIGGTELSADLFSPEPLSTLAPPSFGSTSLDPTGASSLSNNTINPSMSSLFDPAPLAGSLAIGQSNPFDFSSTPPGTFTTLSSVFGPPPAAATPTTPAETPNLFERIGDRVSENFSQMFSTPLGPGQEYRDLVAPFTQPTGTWTDSVTGPFRAFNDALFNGVPAALDGAGRFVGATYHSLVDAGVEGAVSLGMDRSSAERLGRDIHAMPEAFAGMPGAFAPMRAGITPTTGPAAQAYNIATTGMTAAERQAVVEYAQRSNAWLAENGPVTVQATAGTLRSQASAAARTERLNAERAGTPYQGQVGHVPDTALTGLANPPAGWLDMPGTSNNVAGGGLSSRIGQAINVITVDGRVP
jgi:hypothetical protein